MKFNYQSEKKKLERRWKSIEKECQAAGMSEKSIEELRQYDLEAFRKERLFCMHNQYINDYDFEDGNESNESRNPYLVKFSDQLTKEDLYFEDDRYGWIQQLDDEELVRKILALGEERIELLTQYVYGGLTQREIAEGLGITRSAVADRIEVIKKKIKKF